MNNFHIRIEDCTEAQKARLAQIYGLNDCDSNFFEVLGSSRDYTSVYVTDEITPDEMFKRLGLDDSLRSEMLEQELNEALANADKERIRAEKAVARLAKQPLDVDWSLAPDDASLLFQEGHTIGWLRKDEPCLNSMIVLAARPKPKYTKEQIEAVRDFYRFASEKFSNGSSVTIERWLKEQGQ